MKPVIQTILIIASLFQGSFLAKNKKNKKNTDDTVIHTIDNSVNPVSGTTTDDVASYWESQKQYLVNINDFYGTFPQQLEDVVVMLQHQEAFEKLGLYKTSNFIFYGPPGVGKTYLGSIFAQRINAEFMYVQGSELLDKWVASGLSKPEELFKKARARRDATGKIVVMFIDEIDTVIGTRDKFYKNDAELQLIGTMLKEIGSPTNENIIVIGATNRIQDVDQALLRSGRFEYHIEFKLPDAHERFKFIEFCIKSYEYIFGVDVNWKVITSSLSGYTFADLKKLINDCKKLYVLRTIQKNSAPKISIKDIEIIAKTIK